MEWYIIYKEVDGKKYITDTSQSKAFAEAQEALGKQYTHWHCKSSGFPVPSPGENEWIDTRTPIEKRINAYLMETDVLKLEALEDMRENGITEEEAHAKKLVPAKAKIKLRYPKE